MGVLARHLSLRTCPADAGVRGLLPAVARALAGEGPAVLPIAASDPRGSELAAALHVDAPLAASEDDAADPTALVIATSGSTGSPKGVLLSAGQLAASAAATAERLGGEGQWLLTLPVHHIAGMQVLLRSVRAGTDPVAIDLGRPFTAAAFTAAAHKLTGSRKYVSLVPTQLQRVIDDPAARELTADIFDAVLVGGAATPPDLLAAARAANLPIVTSYGMTETCGGCIYDGQPLEGVTAHITADGVMALSGPMVARGYRGQPDHPAFPSLGTFITSDHGEISADGSVRILGRTDEMIISGGLNIAPGPIVAALRQLPGVTDAAVVGVPDQQWGQAVAAVVVSRASWTLADVRAALSAQGMLPARHLPQHLVPATTIPLLPSGKPDLAALRDLAARYSR